MIDRTFELLEFQMINSLLQNIMIEINSFKIIILFLIYISFINKNYIISKIHDFFYKKNYIYLEGKRQINSSRSFTRCDELYSKRFKAIWNYINNNISKLNISSIKEFSNVSGLYNDYGDKLDIDNNNDNGLFIVNQLSSFQIFKDIYCKVFIYEDNYENNNNKINTKRINDTTISLEIYSNKKTIYEINKFLDEIILQYDESLKTSRFNKLFIYSLEINSNNSNNDEIYKYFWNEFEFKSNKNFDNLFFEGKNKFLEKINFFIHNEKFYIKNGIPYTLGILLEGNPGTGKTSIIKCLANYLNRHLVVINMNKIKTNQQLNDIFFEDTYSNKNKSGDICFKKKIYVIEDIDCCLDIVKNRKDNKFSESNNKLLKKKYIKKSKNESQNESQNESESESESESENESDNLLLIKKKRKNENSDKLSLGFILNLLDGIKETPGRIIIITSNHINKIDPAFKRAGRIDLHLKMEKINFNILNEMHNFYYNKNIEYINIKDFNISPAEITNLFINSENENIFMESLNNKLFQINK